MLKKIAVWMARGPWFSRSRHLYAQNLRNWNLPLSKLEKLQVGIYLILEDYGKGVFPPSFPDQQLAYSNEIAFRSALGGMSVEKSLAVDMQLPFWSAHYTAKHLRDFVRILRHLEDCQLVPPARLLELGCGTGWMAEFLAVRGYDVTATTLVEMDVVAARKRITSLQAKGLNCSLRFEAAAMESVSKDVGPERHYDAVIVYHALHHAFDWRKAIESSFACLKPGGWLLVCGEPNLVHTCTSYRMAKLSCTHEVGFSRRQLIRHLQATGYSRILWRGTLFHWWILPHWVCAQKPR